MRGVWVPRMYPSVETEERVFRWMVVATVAFFLLAATSITPGSRDACPVPHQVTRCRPPLINTTAAWREYQLVKEEVFRQVFLKLKDEHKQFWSESEAKSFLSVRTDNKRKAFCGGWSTDVPRLVLKNMGRRCPPFELA